jgi:hypothetical protein
MSEPVLCYLQLPPRYCHAVQGPEGDGTRSKPLGHAQVFSVVFEPPAGIAGCC